MRNFTVGRVFGIPIRLDLTFLLILPILAWIIGTQIGQWADQMSLVFGITLDAAPLQEGSMRWLLGSAAAVGLFLGVLLHELGHSVVAKRYGFPIESITLWILGGIAQLSDQPEDWKQELFIAVAGPIVSIALGVVSYVALVSLPSSLDAVRFVAGYLAFMNFALAAFNLLPGFPMDGGRVLRALLARNRPFARATQIAANVGKWFALLLALVGLFTNLFLVLIAFFIYIGASGEAQRTVMNAAFENVFVRDIMTPKDELKIIEADESVATLLDRMFRERHTGYPVMRDDRLIGMVTLADARQVDEVERDAFRVEDVMTTDLMTVDADDDAMTAFDTMQQNGIGRLLVTEDDELVGLISRTDLMTAFDIVRNTGATAMPPTQSGAAGPSSGPLRQP